MPEEAGKIPYREATTSSFTPKHPPLQAVCCSENSSVPQPPLQEQSYLFTGVGFALIVFLNLF